MPVEFFVTVRPERSFGVLQQRIVIDRVYTFLSCYVIKPILSAILSLLWSFPPSHHIIHSKTPHENSSVATKFHIPPRAHDIQ